MEFDLTITMSIIIGLVATLPQIIVALINNIFQYKTKKLDTYKISKRTAIKDFIDCASEYCESVANYETLFKYHKSLNNLKLYIDDLNLKFVDNLNSARTNNNIDQYYKVLDETITYLSKFVDKK